jgi:hypothetical protein
MKEIIVKITNITRLAAGLALATSVLAAAPALADGTKVGTLTCDTSSGIGLIIVQKQSMTCTFASADGSMTDTYTGSIATYGVALGKIDKGILVWAVIAPNSGMQKGALAGDYGGAGASAAVGVGAGANALVGGTGRAFSLAPLSVEGQTGLNLAGGVKAMTLKAD